MALVITMKSHESVIITTKSGDQVRVELPNGTTKQSRICFFAEDEIKIKRVKKEKGIELKKSEICKACNWIHDEGYICPRN